MTRPDPPPSGGPHSIPAESLADPRRSEDHAPEAARYAVGGELGRGGMGVVHVATDKLLTRQVAVKRPRQDRSSARAQLLREARITARLIHPGIVPIHDLGTDEEGTYYTMPVLSGRTLHDVLPEWPTVRLVRVLEATARALGFAHEQGIVHRDVKPANILLGAHGEVRVLDWGVAFDEAAPDAECVGTVGFQSPEQAAGAGVTPASDVFSVGVVLGRVLERSDRPLLELSAIADRATQADPDDRYSDGGQLAADLERWLDGRPVHAHLYSRRELVLRFARSWRVPLAVAAVALVLLFGLLVGWGWTNGRERDRALAAQQRADGNLAVALWRQADGLRALAARAQAETLAVRALELADGPDARGVLMAWHGTPRLLPSQTQALPCARPTPASDGAGFLCAEPSGALGHGVALVVTDAAGQPRWRAVSEAPAEHPGRAAVRDVRLVGDSVLVLRDDQTTEVWRDGQRLATVEVELSVQLRVADGPAPALHNGRQIGRLGSDHSLAWSPELCETINTAWADHERVVVGCSDSVVFAGPLHAPERIDVPGFPSAVTWGTDLIVGTFDGAVHARRGGDWISASAGVGAPTQLVALPGGVVVLRGEHGEVRLWSAETGAWLASDPGTAAHISPTALGWLAVGETVRRYGPTQLEPILFDRSELGGLAFLRLDPEGERIVFGSAGGAIETWDRRTGRREVVVAGHGQTAKDAAFVGDRLFYTRIGDGTREHPAGLEVAPDARRLAHSGSALLVAPYSPNFVSHDPSGDTTWVPLEGRLLDLAWDGAAWGVDLLGGVWRIDGSRATRPFSVPGAQRLAADGGLLFVAHGAHVSARRPGGAVLWTWEAEQPLTSVAASGRYVVVGDSRGELSVLSRAGVLLARVRGHSRRISSIDITSDVAFSASWDGTARRWGLGAADAAADVLARDVREAWGLTDEDALARH